LNIGIWDHYFISNEISDVSQLKDWDGEPRLVDNSDCSIQAKAMSIGNTLGHADNHPIAFSTLIVVEHGIQRWI
jgi:hypothetical protein